MYQAFGHLFIFVDEIFKYSLTKNVLILDNITQSPNAKEILKDDVSLKRFLRNSEIDYVEQSQTESRRDESQRNSILLDKSQEKPKVSLNSQNKNPYQYGKGYWQTYLNLGPLRRKISALILYVFNVFLIYWMINLSLIINLIGSTAIPMIICCFPGYIYYKHYKLKRSTDEFYSDKLGQFSIFFSLLGIALVIIYTSMYLYAVSEANAMS
eukprot:403354717